MNNLRLKDATSTDRSLSYMSFHRVRFLNPISARNTVIAGPNAAAVWRFGPEVPVNASALSTRESDVWGGVAFYSDLNSAESVLNDLTVQLPLVSEVVESWHALLCPIGHKGQVNWFGATGRFAPAARDPGGTLAVITTAGYNDLPPDELKADLPRRMDFLSNANRVRAWYATLNGNLARAVFQPQPVEADALTCQRKIEMSPDLAK